ncbi:MAG: tail fiber domain-containing protein, partial [Salinivenus sp.]
MVQISSFCRSCLTGLAGLLVLLLIVGGGPRVATAQTPTTTIQNGNNDTRLQLNFDGGFYVPGTFGPTTPADSIPATGTGTRLMWYPAKAAFRAGRVGFLKDGTQWDAAKVGQYSAAFGLDTKASGISATAMGTQTTAGGSAATAMGDETTASNFQATAMGFQTTASGEQATAMGDRTTASGEEATAMGFQTTASGSDATAMGSGTTASGDRATAMGLNTEASGSDAMAMGFGTTAATGQSLSIGKYNSANTSDDNTLFVAGNGSSGARANALVLQENGNLDISGSLTENSDRRLKTSIRPLNGKTLAKLSRLRPVRYQFKNQETHPSGEQIGLVAQDVREEFPALVSGENG